MLAGRRIVLGITGGVAAYKAAYLARRLVEHGAQVRVVMTRSATRFVGAQTLAAITGSHPVVELFDDDDVSPHTTLARWADSIVVAPATAATLSRLATGLSDDAVSATVLASTSPVVLAPAMHTEMWEQPATQRNIATLIADGYTIVGPDVGALAGGDEGVGRLADPDEIAESVAGVLPGGELSGQRVLVTAGGTREPIDPVRFIGNRSSGKMGNAIAVASARRGAAVTLVTTAPAPRHPRVEVIAVETAREMADAVWKAAEDADIALMAAAVADFAPEHPEATKLRRAAGPPQVVLGPTPDILGGLAAMEKRPFLVGFAAETGSIEAAIDKAREKGVDLLVANDVTALGSEFGSDTNEVVIVLPDGSTEPWELMTKSEVAERLLDRIEVLRSGGDTGGAPS
ncbi:MAG: bifunctional phosphopantothenoylcysteine decarboxylase/phosphopantothenate--cysteine ligase CoaBC [Acidobacteria bacterium]|nr:bifunctional phosphopantothenoylcysteine decarboxylase/phosphopantothenate--cysteine ligase CoaBC [Acidobacteriota bacterium]